MKILVANHWLKKIGGSETFTYALAVELRNQGHDVDFYTFEEGIVSQRLKAQGIKLRVQESYDLVLASHYTCVNYLHERGYTIQTVHGTTPRLERPNVKANLLVAISIEVNDHLKKEYNYTSRVISNGVDCERFSPKKKIKTPGLPERVLSLCQSQRLNNELEKIFKKQNILFLSLNKFQNPVWNVEDHINSSDMVISIGRGVLESMACGRPVVILDERDYQGLMGDGFLTPGMLLFSSQYNFSGRFGKRVDVADIISESLYQYNITAESITHFLRGMALTHYNITHQAAKYLEVFNEHNAKGKVHSGTIS
jgi:glycosyltransferase involved in cell wall biosynthesis